METANCDIQMTCEPVNPLRADVLESLVWPRGGAQRPAPHPRKSLKEMSENPYCYLEVRPLSKLGTHEKFRVEIQKNV